MSVNFKYLNQLDVVFALRAKQTVAQRLNAVPLGEDEGTKPAKLE